MFIQQSNRSQRRKSQFNSLNGVDGLFDSITKVVKKVVSPMATVSSKLLGKAAEKILPKAKAPGALAVPKLTEEERKARKAQKQAQASPILSALREYALPIGIGAAAVAGSIAILLITKRRK